MDLLEVTRNHILRVVVTGCPLLKGLEYFSTRIIRYALFFQHNLGGTANILRPNTGRRFFIFNKKVKVVLHFML